MGLGLGMAAAWLLSTAAVAGNWLARSTSGAMSGHWGYQGQVGPEHWGDLAPANSLCKTGLRQSPIDVRGTLNARLPPLSFNYHSNALSVLNDGHTIEVAYEPGSSMRAGAARYELKRLRFHVPSEHRLGGVGADMEVHLEHEDAAGHLAIVAVGFKAGQRMNSTLSKIWEAMPLRTGEINFDHQTGINAVFLLPAERSYLVYEGSLTVPPCTEGVQWFLLTQPVEIAGSYIEKLLRVIGPNVRAVQPLNDRVVEEVRN